MSGKGSKPRPFSVPKEVFSSNYDKIFGSKKDTPKEKESRDDDREKPKRA